jgi:NH3-dependent NAD+ synthetase
VLSTDNYTEYLLGFWTLHGDVGDLGLIQNLWKTEVYGLANYLRDEVEMLNKHSAALYECICATPTDGLGVSSSDLVQLYPEWEREGLDARAAYRKVDELLQEWLYGDWYEHVYAEWPNRKTARYKELVEHPVIRRHEATAYKRHNPYNLPRKDLINWVYVEGGNE